MKFGERILKIIVETISSDSYNRLVEHLHKCLDVDTAKSSEASRMDPKTTDSSQTDHSQNGLEDADQLMVPILSKWGYFIDFQFGSICLVPTHNNPTHVWILYIIFLYWPVAITCPVKMSQVNIQDIIRVML